MHRRSLGPRAPSTRRRHWRIVPLKAMWALAVLVLARTSPLIAGSERPAPQDSPDAFASAETRVAVPAGSDKSCFPVSMDVGTDGVEEHDGYVEGWAFIDRGAHFEGRTCQVKGWVSINPCGRRITAYMASCPDGAFTFMTTEADCHYVIGCSDRPDGAARGASR